MANGMYEIFAPAKKEEKQADTLPPLRLKWESDRLVFVVREPFVSKTSGAEIALTDNKITTRMIPQILLMALARLAQ
jgi:hypothetical protein